MITITTWYDNLAEREIRKAYFYWTDFANNEHKKAKAKTKKEYKRENINDKTVYRK